MIVEGGGTAPVPRPDRSVDAVVALGGFQDPDAIARIVGEARRLLVPNGLFAASWVDPSRPSLEAPGESPSGRAPVTPAEATRRLQERFASVVVVARQPYLGFQYVSGVDTQGALTLDSSLTGGGAESPTGYLALASDSPLPLGDALIQVPYDRAVERIEKWAREQRPSTSPTIAVPRGAQVVARPRDGGSELERLRVEVASLRDRAQAAIEEGDRSRGEIRTARERAALLEAEVSKLRGRLKGAPDAEAEELRKQLESRTSERDLAVRDLTSAAGEVQRALEAAAKYEREVDFLNDRVHALERELEQAREERDSALRDLEGVRAEAAAGGEADVRAKAAEQKFADAEQRLAELERRNSDLVRRGEQGNRRLEDSQKKIAELEEAKTAAERSAEDAWRRVREAAAQAPGPDMVPASDLVAAQGALASAVARAEDAERERRRLSEGAASSAQGAIAELQTELASVRHELEAARRRGEDADARAASAQRQADDARTALDESRAVAGATEDVEGLKSLIHQRETAMGEARTRAETAEARAARFSTEASDALGRAKLAEESLAEREAELKRALQALEGFETREARNGELIAELKGEVARLTTAVEAAREDVKKASQKGADLDSPELRKVLETTAMAQAEAARAHAEAEALKEGLEASRTELEKLQADQEKKTAQYEERERRIAELEAELMQLKSQGGSKGDIERRAVQMSSRLAQLEAELERARDDVKQANAEARKYRALAEAIDPPSERSR